MVEFWQLLSAACPVHDLKRATPPSCEGSRLLNFAGHYMDGIQLAYVSSKSLWSDRQVVEAICKLQASTL